MLESRGYNLNVNSGSIVIGLFFAILLLPTRAYAGKITISGAEPNSIATITYNDGSSTPVPVTLQVDSKGNAEFVATKFIQENAFNIKKTYIPKGQAPATNTERASFVAGTLPELEPFELPNFSDVAGMDLLWEIDVNNFLSEEITFSIGQILNVTGGSISETSTIVFPGFTGEVEVTSFDKFTSVPEPNSVLSFLTLGTLGAASTLKRKLKPSKSTEKENIKVG